MAPSASYPIQRTKQLQLLSSVLLKDTWSSLNRTQTHTHDKSRAWSNSSKLFGHDTLMMTNYNAQSMVAIKIFISQLVILLLGWIFNHYIIIWFYQYTDVWVTPIIVLYPPMRI